MFKSEILIDLIDYTDDDGMGFIRTRHATHSSFIDAIQYGIQCLRDDYGAVSVDITHA